MGFPRTVTRSLCGGLHPDADSCPCHQDHTGTSGETLAEVAAPASSPEASTQHYRFKKRILTKSSSCNYRSCVPSTHGINVMYHVTTNPKTRSSSSLSQGEEKKSHGWRSWLVCGGSGWVPAPASGFLSLQIQVSACRNSITPSERPLPFMPNFCRYYYLKGRNPIYPSINSLYHLPQHRLYHSQISIRQQFRIPI